MRHGAIAAILFVMWSSAISAPALLAQSAAPAAASTHRLFLRFTEDAAVVPNFWLEGKGRWITNAPSFGDTGDATESNLFGIEPVLAFNVAEDFEFGARIGYLQRNPEDGDSDWGQTDLDLWGKVSVATDPFKFTVGLLMTAPTGDEDSFLGTGETNVELFAGLRKDLQKWVFSGNAGMRVNQDFEAETLELEGQNSFLGGVGLMFLATRALTLHLEFAIEGARFEGQGTESRLLGGFDLGLGQSWMLRGAAVAGLSSEAADFEAIGSIVWLP